MFQIACKKKLSSVGQLPFNIDLTIQLFLHTIAANLLEYHLLQIFIDYPNNIDYAQSLKCKCGFYVRIPGGCASGEDIRTFDTHLGRAGRALRIWSFFYQLNFYRLRYWLWNKKSSVSVISVDVK